MPDFEVSYKVGEKTYHIPESKSGDFLKDFPDAQEIRQFTVGENKYSIPTSKVDMFQMDMPDAKPTRNYKFVTPDYPDGTDFESLHKPKTGISHEDDLQAQKETNEYNKKQDQLKILSSGEEISRQREEYIDQSVQPKNEDDYFNAKIEEGDTTYGLSTQSYNKYNKDKQGEAERIVKEIEEGKSPDVNKLIGETQVKFKSEADSLRSKYGLDQKIDNTNQAQVDEYNKKIGQYNDDVEKLQKKYDTELSGNVDKKVQDIAQSFTESIYFDKEDLSVIDQYIKRSPKTYNERKAYIETLIKNQTMAFDEKEKPQARKDLFNIINQKLLFDEQGNPTTYALKNQAETRMKQLLEDGEKLRQEIEPEIKKYGAMSATTGAPLYATGSSADQNEKFILPPALYEKKQRLERIREAVDRYNEVLNSKDDSDGKVGGFWENFDAKAMTNLATAGYYGAAEAMHIADLATKGKATQEEKDIVNAVMLKNALEGRMKDNYSMAHTVGKGITDSLPFITSMMSTMGVSGLVQGGVKKALKWQLTKSLKNRAISGLSKATATAIQVPLSGMYYQGIAERDVKIEASYKDGKFEANVIDLKNSKGYDAYRQFLQTYPDFLTERFEPQIAKYITHPVYKRLKLGFLTKEGTSKLSKTLKAFNVSDLGTEIMGEEIAGLMNIATGDQKASDFFNMNSQVGLLLTMAVMVTPAKAIAALSKQGKDGIEGALNKSQLDELNKIMLIEAIPDKAKSLTQFAFDHDLNEDQLKEVSKYAWDKQVAQTKEIAEETKDEKIDETVEQNPDKIVTKEELPNYQTTAILPKKNNPDGENPYMTEDEMLMFDAKVEKIIANPREDVTDRQRVQMGNAFLAGELNDIDTFIKARREGTEKRSFTEFRKDTRNEQKPAESVKEELNDVKEPETITDKTEESSKNTDKKEQIISEGEDLGNGLIIQRADSNYKNKYDKDEWIVKDNGSDVVYLDKGLSKEQAIERLKELKPEYFKELSKKVNPEAEKTEKVSNLESQETKKESDVKSTEDNNLQKKQESENKSEKSLPKAEQKTAETVNKESTLSGIEVVEKVDFIPEKLSEIDQSIADYKKSHPNEFKKDGTQKEQYAKRNGSFRALLLIKEGEEENVKSSEKSDKKDEKNLVNSQEISNFTEESKVKKTDMKSETKTTEKTESEGENLRENVIVDAVERQRKYIDAKKVYDDNYALASAENKKSNEDSRTALKSYANGKGGKYVSVLNDLLVGKEVKGKDSAIAEELVAKHNEIQKNNKKVSFPNFGKYEYKDISPYDVFDKKITIDEVVEVYKRLGEKQPEWVDNMVEGSRILDENRVLPESEWVKAMELYHGGYKNLDTQTANTIALNIDDGYQYYREYKEKELKTAKVDQVKNKTVAEPVQESKVFTESEQEKEVNKRDFIQEEIDSFNDTIELYSTTKRLNSLVEEVQAEKDLFLSDPILYADNQIKDLKQKLEIVNKDDNPDAESKANQLSGYKKDIETYEQIKKQALSKPIADGKKSVNINDKGISEEGGEVGKGCSTGGEKGTGEAEKSSRDLKKEKITQELADDLAWLANIKEFISEGQKPETIKRLYRVVKNAVELGEIKLEEGIEYLIKKFSNLKTFIEDNRDEIIPKAELKKEKLSGIKKALVSDEVISDVKLDKVSDKELLSIGKELVESGEVNPREIVDEINLVHRALQPKEVVGLIAYKVDLDTKVDKLYADIIKAKEDGRDYKELEAKSLALEQQLLAYETMQVITASQQSLAFRLRKGLLNREYKAVEQISRYIAKSKDGKIPDDIRELFIKTEQELKEVKEKLRLAEEKAKNLEDKIAEENILEEEKRNQKNTPRKTKSIQEASVEIANLLRKGKIHRPGVFASATPASLAFDLAIEATAKTIEVSGKIIQGIADGIKILRQSDWFKELTKEDQKNAEKEFVGYINKTSANKEFTFDEKKGLRISGGLLKKLIGEGKLTIEEWTADIHALISEIYPEITEVDVRDAITGYGRKANPTKSDVATLILQQKAIGKLLSALEDVQEKLQLPKKSESQKRELTEKETQLKKQLAQAIKDLPTEDFDVTKVSNKDYLKQAKKQAERRINELRERIRTGNFSKGRYDKDGNFIPAEKRKLIPDDELTRLEAEKIRLQEIFEKEQYGNELRSRPTTKKIADIAMEAVALTRVVAGGDFSAIGLQGLIRTITRPKAVPKNMIEMFRQFASEKRYHEFMQRVKTTELYKTLKASGGYLSEESLKFKERDEQFQSGWVNHIWSFIGRVTVGIGKNNETYRNSKTRENWEKFNLYKASQRAYESYINLVRLQACEEYFSMFKNMGLTFENSPEDYKAVASFSNNVTLRGKLYGSLERSADVLSIAMFSPRKAAGTFNILNPRYFFKMHQRSPIMAKKALRNMLEFWGTIATTAVLYQLIGALNGDDDNMEFDPRSSRFLKPKVNGKYIDITAGMAGYISSMVQFSTGYMKNDKGEIIRLGTSNNATQKDVGQRFWENKAAPTLSIALSYWGSGIDEETGVRTDPFGEEITVGSVLKKSTLMIWAQNLDELYEEGDDTVNSGILFLSLFGFGANPSNEWKRAKKKIDKTYEPKKISTNADKLKQMMKTKQDRDYINALARKRGYKQLKPPKND